ncbi:MAG: ribosome maturation factor RimM [Actinomycetota bacterium]
MDRIVARLGRPHGIAGELSAHLHTDMAENRLMVGSQLRTDSPGMGVLTVQSWRRHHGRVVMKFAEVTDRDTAESLRGAHLLVPQDHSDEPDAWYLDELVGLSVWHVRGYHLGTVTNLEQGVVQDILVVSPNDDDEVVRVPFVTALVPVVDVPGGRVVIDPPGGLFPNPPHRDAPPQMLPSGGA